MPIPEEQLEIWSRQGAAQIAASTYNSIQNALEDRNSAVRALNYEVYLHGSYRNSTNIRASSDVDVTVQLNSAFIGDTSSLTPYEQAAYLQAYRDVTYSWADFRQDVLTTLRGYYGASAVKEGNKSIKVADGSNRLPADIVVALQYRRYSQFLGLDTQRYAEGIAFWSRKDGRLFVNFPKLHYQNGVAKNDVRRTNGRLKPTVRIFKNARTYLSDRRFIGHDLAPSHLVESLLYNVPDPIFLPYGSTFQQTLVSVLNWLGSVEFGSFIFQHEQMYLFGNTVEQWSVQNAKSFIRNVIDLWNGWA